MNVKLEGNILITGGAGFLGRGIIRRAHREGWKAKFLVVSRDQQKHAYLQSKYPDVQCALGDILDTPRLQSLMTLADFVIHAAALKHLPECEAQPSQALRVNIDGTRSVMDAILASGVQRAVFISTDKAAAPLNTYGYTKALVERLVFESVDLPSSIANPTFNAVRYGNVIGSTGSIWPVFKRQAAEKQYLSVTDPNMTRFFVSIEEAVDIVLSAFVAPGGTVVIPQPKALRIGDLADYLTKEWNLGEPSIVGLRAGEKNHEAMLAFSEREQLTPHGDYFALYGPTKKPAMTATMRGETSEGADRITPEEFVAAAIDSEDV